MSDTGRAVNGCDPTRLNLPGPLGMCRDGLPHFACCSAGEVSWSGIVAGSDIDIKGSVPIDPRTGRPQSSAVLVIGPSGSRTAIHVGSNGAFAQYVHFPTAGRYQIGVLYQGAPANLQAFDVAWKYRVVRGPILAQVFPASGASWPPSDNTYLTAPMGKTTTWSYT